MHSTITDPGTAQHRKHGAYTITLSLPVDAGYTINTQDGSGDRIPALSFTFATCEDANNVFRVIADAADQHLPVEHIAELVRERLVCLAAQYRNRHGYGARVANLDAALDIVEPLAFTADTEPAEVVRPRTFAELRDAHQAGIARQRAEAVAR